MSYRDPLTPTPSVPAGSNAAELAAIVNNAMQDQNTILIDIRNQLLKLNPPVLTKTIVQNAGAQQTLITDTDQHEVFFEIGGKSVTVCKLKIWSTYTTTVYYSFQRMSSPLDGIPFVAGNVLNDDIEAKSVYIWCPELAASNELPVNGNATTSYGAFSLYGWTTPDNIRAY